jgi:putative lipoic acid-binding regulatory protein
MNNSNEEIFNFPCDYPIKIFGKKHPEFKHIVCSIVERHAGQLHDKQVSEKVSSKGSYVSLTVRIIATSRAQLDAMNEELQKCPQVTYLL